MRQFIKKYNNIFNTNFDKNLYYKYAFYFYNKFKKLIK